jgi:CCR4-NOT transcription complex subunit 1
VVDWSNKIAMTMCEQIVKKDFTLDSEESRVGIAAHCMMQNLTGGMAMITCWEPLLMSVSIDLKIVLPQPFLLHPHNKGK